MGTSTLDTGGSGAQAEQRSPFQGLGYYTEEDADWFFGRAAERKIILAHLRTARLTLLYAESGVGKSSLLRAGVAARLRELSDRSDNGSRAPRFLPIVFSAWKDQPVQDLIAEIHRHAGSEPGDGNGIPAPERRPARGGLATAIIDAAAGLQATLVIILDQFEENLGHRQGRDAADVLAGELAECINSPDVPANFLIAVREDVYGGLGDLFSGRISNIYGNYLHLEYLTRDAAREAIEKPVGLYNAQHAGDPPVTVEPELTEAVLDEVRRGRLELGRVRRDGNGATAMSASGEDAIETPFLQLVMTRLWDCELAEHSHVLRRATLDQRLGGAEAIVRNHVDRALAGLDGAELDATTDIFRDLVTPSGVKVAHTADDLARMTGHPRKTVAQVLQRLYEERIVRGVDPAPGSSDTRYEIFHDRLAAPILDWRDHQENARLERARENAELEARTQRAQAHRYRRRARIMLGLVVSLLVLLVAVVVLLRYARDQTAAAGRARRAAVSDTRQATYFGLTTRAASALSSRPDVSLLLYLAAYSESPRRVAERNLVATLQAVERSGAVGVLHGHTDAVESIAFSPTSTLLASASADRTIRLWTVSQAGHHPAGAPLRGDGPQYSVAFAPNGRLLASGSFNDVTLWSVTQHAAERVIPDAAGAVTSVAFAPRGNLLAAGGSNGTVLLLNTVSRSESRITVPGAGEVRSVAFNPSGAELAISRPTGVVLWDVVHDREIGSPLTGRLGGVYTVAFSPDGQSLAAAGGSGAIDVWRLAAPNATPTVLGGGTPVNSVAFSPDSRTLAAGGDGTTALWNLADDRRLGAPLRGHQGTVYSVAFNRTGTMLASAGADRTIALWDYPVRRRYGQPLVTRSSKVHSVAISPDGSQVASGTDDGVIFVSDRATGRLLRVMSRPAAGQVEELAFDPGAHVLASAYADGTIRLWTLNDGRQLRPPLPGGAGPTFSIAFNGAGTKLVSGGLDGKVRLWDMRTHREIGRPMTGDLGAVYAVAFTRDGREIASGGSGRAIRLWSAETQSPLDPPLIAQEDAVFSLAFSPAGDLLASGGAGDAIHLWRLHGASASPMYTLTGHSAYVRSLAFSPGGAVLASGSTDTTVRLWDVASGSALDSPLTGHAKSVESVAYSHDGRFVVSGGADRTVRLWQGIVLPSSFARLRSEVCAFLGAGLNRVEWSQYASDIPYHKTCARTAPA